MVNEPLVFESLKFYCFHTECVNSNLYLTILTSLYDNVNSEDLGQPCLDVHGRLGVRCMHLACLGFL